jgi:hypothetical protein
MAGPEFEVGPLVDPSIIVERAFREFAMAHGFPLEAALPHAFQRVRWI